MAGPAAIHDRLRVTAQNKPTYQTIVNNLIAVSGLVKIVIECQYDARDDTYLRMPEMLDDFMRLGIEISDVHFTPILPRRQDKKKIRELPDPKKQHYVQEAARAKGFSSVNEPPLNSCMANMRAKLVFDSDGSIIPCPSLQGGEMAYGHVHEGIDFTREAQLCQRPLPKRCLKDCSLLPLCLGGCRNQALVQDNDFDGVACRRDELLFLVKQYMEKQVEAME
jgi:radical SAM protein with 4Fe4S-binding SPASM domain